MAMLSLIVGIFGLGLRRRAAVGKDTSLSGESAEPQLELMAG
jgi:hypothetical protein